MSVKLSQIAVDELDALLAAYPQAGMPGTVVGVVGRDGQELYLNSSGPNDVSSGEPMRADTIFPIFSCTKIITAISCMQAVERGLMKLDEPVTQLLPELAELSVITGSQGDEVKTGVTRTPITLRMLLTHTAGWGYSWYQADLAKWVKQQNLDFSDKIHLVPLVNEPGTTFEYGMNMDWAGLALEAATGKSLGDWAQENIFDPLQLKEISMAPLFKKGRDARLHLRKGLSGPCTPTDALAGIAEVPAKGGGGGAYATASDFLQVLVPLLNNGRFANGAAILKDETVKAMYEDQMPILGIKDLGALATTAEAGQSADPEISGGGLHLLPGQRKGWGLSFLYNHDDVPGGRKAGSAEWGGVANLFWIADPTTGIAAVVFNSILPYGQPEFIDLETKVQEVLFKAGHVVSAK